MFSVFFASDRSSSGKSMITMAFSKKVKELGYRVNVFKTGPDFLDPIVISRAVKTEVKNLDPFLIPAKFLNSWVFNGGDDMGYNGDLNKKRAFIVESAMGLYDGNSYKVAKNFKFPVVLVMDSKRISSTMASLVYGLKKYKKWVNVCGVILNNISSARHYQIIFDEIKENIKDIEVFGYVLNDEGVFSIKERHLGLIAPITQKKGGADEGFEKIVNNIKDEVFHNINIDLMIRTLEKESDGFNNLFFNYVGQIKNTQFKAESNKNNKGLFIKKKNNKNKKVKIAVAYDKAFFFYYNFNFEILKSFGAEIVFFSPLVDKTIPKGTGVIYIGGGYPEIYAKNLAENHGILNEIYKFFKNNGIIYAECGGLMYLSKSLTYKGESWDLSGILPFNVTMDNTGLSLGYRNVYLREKSFLGDKGLRVNGHEFHYSKIITNDQNDNRDNRYSYDNHNPDNLKENSVGFKNVFECESLASPGILKKEGYNVLNAVGSYVHLSFFSNKLIAKNIIDNAKII